MKKFFTLLVLALAMLLPPTVFGNPSISNAHSSSTDDLTPIHPFQTPNVSITSPQASVTVTATLDPAKGFFSTLSGFTDNGGGSYSFTGDPAIATTNLRGMVFKPVPTGASETDVITLVATDSDGSTTNANTVITVCATTLIVVNDNDSGPGSLREAILKVTACGSKSITFAPSAYGTITLTNGELLISEDLKILGPGATNVAVNGNAASRVFHVTNGVNAVIADLTITNGSDIFGGGIYNNNSVVTVSNCTLSGNSVSGAGGGIDNAGDVGSATLTVANSTLSSNSATSLGGGIYSQAVSGTVTVTVVNSTLSGNSAHGGGAIANNSDNGSATLTIANSTLSDNSASFAGGIYNKGNAGSATMEISSTILNASPILNFSGTVTSLGYNLSSDGGGGVLTNATDHIDTDPMLGPLQLNGGQTPTHALLCESPAIDAGTNFAASAKDQTGAPRIFNNPVVPDAGDGTDIGAFESQNSCPIIVCSNVTVSADSNCQANASIDGGSVDPDSGDTITLSQDPPGPYPLGTTNVTLTVTDSHGASNSCTATVTVVDKTPPTVICPDNITATNDPGQCSATVDYTVTATDNCGTVTNVTADLPPGTFPGGTNTVHVTAVDDAGNTNTCSFTVTVLDKEAPHVTSRPAPNPSGKINEPGKGGSASNPNGYYQVLAKDNCDANPVIFVKDTGSSLVAGPFHDGDIVRMKHAGGVPSIAYSTGTVKAILTYRGNGLAIAKDVGGNTTPDANGSVMLVSK